jgi:hypothetical protein
MRAAMKINELFEIFNKAMTGIDPGPLFDKLRKEKDDEHKNSSN